jgi:hypothetical protein
MSPRVFVAAIVMSGSMVLSAIPARAGVVLLNVTPSMVSKTADAAFNGASTSTTVADPVPFGTANNINDKGWILNWGGIVFDMTSLGGHVAVEKFRIYSSYTAAARGAVWLLQYSDDATNWTTSTSYAYATAVGSGWTSLSTDGTFSGTNPSNYSGWYGIDFNTSAIAARYWRVEFSSATTIHSPRSAEIWLYGEVLPEPTSWVLMSLGGVALAGCLARRRGRRARSSAPATGLGGGTPLPKEDCRSGWDGAPRSRLTGPAGP